MAREASRHLSRQPASSQALQAHEFNRSSVPPDETVPIHALLEDRGIAYRIFNAPVDSRGGAIILGDQRAEGDIINNFGKPRRFKFMRWLSSIPHPQHHKSISTDILPGSGKWLFRNPKYTNWEQAHFSCILWLHGIPGSGKTKLVSLIVEKLVNSEPGTSVAYFYCSRSTSEPKRSNPDEIMSCILKQLAVPEPRASTAAPVIAEWSKRQDEADDMGLDEPPSLHISESVNLILLLLKTTPAIIIIDALDECNPSRRHEILQALDILIQSAEKPVKIFVSSRDDDDIVYRLTHSPNVYINARDNAEDIRRYVFTEVNKVVTNGILLDGKVSYTLRQKIIGVLINGADGMFMWVSLQIQNLCNRRRIKHEADIWMELGRLPRSLSEQYDRIYAQILESAPLTRKIANQALQWLLCAQRRLSSREFIAAVTLGSQGLESKVTEADILATCCNLIILNKELDTFQLAHLSVREYLEMRTEFDQGNLHQFALDRCLFAYTEYLTEWKLSSQIQPSYRNFYGYATRHWTDHLSALDYAANFTDCRDKVNRLVSQIYQSAAPDVQARTDPIIEKHTHESLPLRSDQNSVHIAIKMSSSQMPPTLETRGRFPIVWDGFIELENSTQHLSIAQVDSMAQTVLTPEWALENLDGVYEQLQIPPWTWHKEVQDAIQPLHRLFSSVIPKLESQKYYHFFYHLAILFAMDLEYFQTSEPSSSRTTTYRLRRRHERLDFGLKVLASCAQSEPQRTFDLLQSRLIPPSERPPSLSAIARVNRRNLEQFIAERNPSPTDLTDDFIMLHYFLLSVDTVLVSLIPHSLFNSDLDLGDLKKVWNRDLDESVDYLDKSLSALFVKLQSYVLELRYEVLPEKKDDGIHDWNRSILSLTSEAGHLHAFFRTLNENPEAIDIADDTGRTPLSFAAGAGHERIVKALIRESANVNKRDSQDHSPMWWALKGGHEAVAWHLLSCSTLEARDRRLCWQTAPEWALRERLTRRFLPIAHPAMSGNFRVSRTSIFR